MVFIEEVNEAHTVLGNGARFVGKLNFEGIVKIDGFFEGEVFSTGTLIVGENGHIVGNIESESVSILGKVEGDVKANDLVEIKAEGYLKGTIQTKDLIVERGAHFDGQCIMKVEEQEQPKTEPQPVAEKPEKPSFGISTSMSGLSVEPAEPTKSDVVQMGVDTVDVEIPASTDPLASEN